MPVSWSIVIKAVRLVTSPLLLCFHSYGREGEPWGSTRVLTSRSRMLSVASEEGASNADD